MSALQERLTKIFQRPDSILRTKYRKQLLATLIVNIITFSHGIDSGWTAPMLPKLMSEESPVNFPVTINDASWIGSLFAFGSIFGNLILCNLIDIIGRKLCLYIMAVPHACHWILIYFAPSVEYVLVARFLGGLTTGACNSFTPLYLSEISDPNMRGTFTVFVMVAINTGTLIGYIMATHLQYHLIPCVVIVFPIIYGILLLYLPETPQYLIKKHRDEAALKSLCFYKNSQEATPKCQQDFKELITTMRYNEKLCSLTIKDFVTPAALKAFPTALILAMVCQLSGSYAFIVYMSDIFIASGAPFEPNTCTIIMGVIQLVGNLISAFFVDRFGRKVLMLISVSGVVLGTTTFGCYTNFLKGLDNNAYSWLPLALMIIIVFAINIGITSIATIIVIELLPTKIRSIGVSCFILMQSLFVTAVLKIFPLSLHSFGISITMWSSTTILGFCLIYLIIFLKETKGKKLECD